MKKIAALALSVLMLITSVNFGAFSTYTVAAEAAAEDSERFDKVERLIDKMLTEDGPENGSLWNMENTTAFKWSYINGCMASAMMQLYGVKNDKKYLDFADNYMKPFIGETKSDTKGYIADKSFKISNYALDDLNSGKALIELSAFGSANKTLYDRAVEDTLYTSLLKTMMAEKTTAEGNLWHKNAYPYQVWLDGIYMETPFYLEYELEIADDKTAFTQAANNVVLQIENVYNRQRNTANGLYYHGYDAQADKKSGSYNQSSAMSWAVKDEGHSQNCWLRGTGWYAMALVDNIELMQKAEARYGIDLTAQKSSLAKIYTELMEAMLTYRDESTKMWYQVIDHPGENYNYIETSGSAAMSYALMKGYNIGIANKDFYTKGLESFRGICDNKLTYSDSSKTSANLSGICITAGLAGPSSGATSSSATIGPKHKARDGSYDYYVSEKTVDNDAKGIAPLIFAYCQVLACNGGSGETTTEAVSETTTEKATDKTTETTTEKTTETTTEKATETTTESCISHVGETIYLGGGSDEVLKPTDFSAGDCTASKTVGSFTLNGSSSKKITVYSAYIDLCGGGEVEKPRNIAVKTSGAATISVKAFNNGSADRTLAIKNQSGTVSQTLAIAKGTSAATCKTLTCEVSGADTYYVFSQSGGLKITEISVTYKNGDSLLVGDVDLDGTIDKKDAALLLKHIAGEGVLEQNNLTAADCNFDEKHELRDVIAILQYIKNK